MVLAFFLLLSVDFGVLVADDCGDELALLPEDGEPEVLFVDNDVSVSFDVSAFRGFSRLSLTTSINSVKKKEMSN